MTLPENTSKRDPAFVLLAAMSPGGTDAYITGMEADGQRQLVASEALPTETQGGDDAFLALGFTFGPASPGDPIFRPATLPEGWRRTPSDHSMWSYIVDQLGRRRVSVFYKAAFYDRSAFMRLNNVRGYASELFDADGTPVFDDAWCTREVFAAALAEMRKYLVERVDLYERNAGNVSWAAESLAETKAELSKHDAWASRVMESITDGGKGGSDG